MAFYSSYIALLNKFFCPSFYSLFLEILCYKLMNLLRWTEDQPNTPYVQTPKMYAFVFPHKKSTQLLFDIVNIVLYIVIKQENECIFYHEWKLT